MESARKIMDRAVQTIDIANAKDKMNLWIAYMNLENTYGSPTNFKTIVERALLVNEKKEIYKHLISIYKLCKKYDLAFEVLKIAIKEYFEDITVWKNFVEFLFEVKSLKNNSDTDANLLKKLDSIMDTKDGLTRCLQSLIKNKHLEVNYF